MIFDIGETVKISASIRNEAGALYDPSSVTIDIKAPDKSVVVSAANMATESTGLYKYEYTVPMESAGIIGTYKYRILVSEGSRNLIQTGTFDVVGF